MILPESKELDRCPAANTRVPGRARLAARVLKLQTAKLLDDALGRIDEDASL